MRLHTINAKNFLSLRDCHIMDLDSHMNFFVGPNGSGKTAIFHLLRMVRDVITDADKGEKPTLNNWCARGVLSQEIDVSVDVEFDTLWEKELIVAFLCTALSQPLDLYDGVRGLILLKNLSEELPVEHLIPFTTWLMQRLCPETVPFLFRGNLRITYQGVYDFIRISYTFIYRNKPFTIVATPFASSVPFASNVNGVFWQGNPPQTLLAGPAGGTLLVEYLKTTQEENKSQGWYKFRDELFNERNEEITLPLDIEAFFQFLGDKRGNLSIDLSLLNDYAFLPTYAKLRNLSGIEPGTIGSSSSGQKFTFSSLLSLLLNRALVFTNNIRTPLSPLINLNVNQALSHYENLDNEQQVPIWLFRLKNGNMEEQARFRRIQKTFMDLLGKGQCFDLTTKLFLEENRDPLKDSLPEPNPTIDLRVTDAEGGDIPLLYHGAGAWEALVLSTLLDESEGKIILLDEPAANLHPGMQSKLLEVFRAAPGQVIVVTHSAQLLPTYAHEFQCVYRMQKSHLGTQIFSLGKTFAGQQDKLENELRASSDVAALLFANAVLLVEGGTEIGAFNEWFPQSSASQGETFAGLNIILHAVGGKAEFPFYIRFLTAFAIPWGVICDGDALPPSKNPNDKLWKVLKELQLIPELPDAETSFDVLREKAASCGIYTYNM